MTKQVITVEIICNQTCPVDLPDTCAECSILHKAQIKTIEVLSDKRQGDEIPPEVDKFGKLLCQEEPI